MLINFFIHSLALLSVALVVALVVLLAVRRLLQSHHHAIYAVQDKHGIERLESATIGGIQQWLHIRGRKKDNPLLLFLHGGPGWPHIGWYDAIQRPWENHFTVVQWDQRQTGKSYQSLNALGDTLSHQQYLQDAEEVITYLRQTFAVDKIILMGTSYGSYLGMHLIKKHPDWFYAYVGVGQVVAMAEHVEAEQSLLLAEAKQQGNTALVNRIHSIQQETDPDKPELSFYHNAGYLMDQASRMGKAYCNSLSSMLSLVALEKWFSPHYTLRDNVNRQFGSSHDASHPFAKAFMHYDLPREIGSEFDVPIFFFTGSHDYHVAYTVTDRWFQQIKAPHKEQLWFEDSAHVPFQTEPAAFAAALIHHVLPMTQSEQHSSEGSIRFE